MRLKKPSDLFDLDENNLDEEWKAQPKLYYEQAVLLAQAREEWEQAKAERDVVEAEQDMDVRRFPDKYNVEKITEGVVSKVVKMSVEYTRANDEVIRRKYKVDLLQATVDALDHRKKALENLVHLFLANYFAKPSVRGEAGDEMERRQRQGAFSGKRDKNGRKSRDDD